MRKNRSVQSLRGFACLMLVLYHMVGSTALQGLRIHDGWLRVLTDLLAVVRMPLFAFLAGAMYGYSRLRGKRLVTDKFKRLIVPMLTVGTLFALVQYGVPGANRPVQDLYLMHIVPVVHYWFLESLFLIFCLLAIVESAQPLNSVLSWSIAFLASLFMYLMHLGFIWFGILGATYLLPFFLLGLAFTRLGWTALPGRAWWGTMLIAGGCAALALLVVTDNYANRFTPAVLLTGLVLSAGLWLRPPNAAWLAHIGDHSMAIFLFHVFFTAAARMVLNRLGFTSVAPHLLVGLLSGLMGPAALKSAIAMSPSLSQWLMGVSVRREQQKALAVVTIAQLAKSTP
jgi:surface polysaccharide O-acyltransferase-like enzyme